MGEKREIQLKKVSKWTVFDKTGNKTLGTFSKKEEAKERIGKYRERNKKKGFTVVGIKKRDGYKCRLCGYDDDLVVHHITPKILRGKNEYNNLLTVCSFCHKFLHYNPMFRHTTFNTHSDLTKLGLKKAAEKGRFPGRPKKALKQAQQ